MIVTIMQPAYLPWLGYFDRLLKSDCFVVLDHVDMDRNSKTKFTNRNRIRTSRGTKWLTVPVRSSGTSGNLPISDMRIADDSSWRRKHLATIKENYARAAYIDTYIDFIEVSYHRDWSSLSALCNHFTVWMMKVLGLEITTIRSSEMELAASGSSLILEICRQLEATAYISGPFGRDYLRRQDFLDASINLLFHDYAHPQYSQVSGGFESHLSCLDLILNHGPSSLGILSTDSTSLKSN